MSGYDYRSAYINGLILNPTDLFWSPTLTEKDPKIPVLPLLTPAAPGGPDYLVTAYTVNGSAFASVDWPLSEFALVPPAEQFVSDDRAEAVCRNATDSIILTADVMSYVVQPKTVH